MDTLPDYYQILAIDSTSTEQDIRRQYRRLVKIYHPDRNPGEEEWCGEQLKKVNDAYRVLSSSSLRAAYDRQVQERRRSNGAGATAGPEWKAAGDGRSTYSRWRPDVPVPTPAAPAPSPPKPSQPSSRRKHDVAKAATAAGLLGITAVVVVYGLMQPSPPQVAPTANAVTAPSTQPATTHALPHHHRKANPHRVVSHEAPRLTAAEKDRRAAALAAAAEQNRRESGGTQ
jgi:hypothetical protein